MDKGSDLISEHTVIYYCAPTLAGIKTANLFCQDFQSPWERDSMIAAWNRKLNPSGIYVTILRTRGQRKKLKRNLTAVRARVLLKRFGYRSLEIEDALFRLRGRFTAEEDFPHEIGLFLGYPIEDVEGFIANGGKGCKCSGCWKVYGDVEKAQALFDSYKECRRRLMTQWNHGASVTSLAVAL